MGKRNKLDLGALRDECLETIVDGARQRKPDAHDRVAIRVFRRLQLRQAQLKALDELTRLHLVHEAIAKTTSQSEGSAAASSRRPDDKPLSPLTMARERALAAHFPDMRAYHLAVTDLFVEKAIVYLEKEANLYRVSGIVANAIAVVIILIGVLAAGYQAWAQPLDVHVEWSALAATFMRNFTAFGMLVILAVAMRRFGRAMLDQGERLFERRHAMRQGRLFVHLNDGILSVDELERAFNWNAAGSNAFGSMQTEDQAPFGAAFKEFMRQAPELLKASLKHATRGLAEGDAEPGSK